MFERYTEKARRVIFFARYEASQFGSPYIETEHLLLGLIREDMRHLPRVLPRLNPDLVRKEIEQRSRGREKISTSVDLPVSNEGKRVLAYAAEEAERLGHRHIGTEHLLLGLLREEESYAADILRRYGARLESLRGNVASTASGDFVLIHEAQWDRGFVESAVANNRRFLWRKQAYAAPDVVVQRSDGAISFDTGLAKDTSAFEMVKGGWQETTCLICHWKLEESDNPEHNTGYTNGRDWLCCECYEKLFI